MLLPFAIEPFDGAVHLYLTIGVRFYGSGGILGMIREWDVGGLCYRPNRDNTEQHIYGQSLEQSSTYIHSYLLLVWVENNRQSTRKDGLINVI